MYVYFNCILLLVQWQENPLSCAHVQLQQTDTCTVFMHAAYAGIERIVAQEHDHQRHQMQPFPVSTKCTVHHHFNLLEQNRYCHNTVYIFCSQNYQQLSFENNNAPPLPLHGQDSRSLWLSWPFFYYSLFNIVSAEDKKLERLNWSDRG